VDAIRGRARRLFVTWVTWVAGAASFAYALGAPRVASADETGAGAGSPAAVAEAKEIFSRGLALLDAGDLERALDYFLRSRALVPGKGNTANAAHCLERLGRYDEALELYEELVTRFASELGPENRARLGPAMAALRSRVGSALVIANVDGALVMIDGRARGRLPLAHAVRVLAGRHRAQVLKDGYESAEAPFLVAAGETANVDLPLRPLAQAGRLRIEDPSNEGAEVLVDRVRVGTAPWEGTLAPGAHLVWVAAGDRGSAPARAIVVQGQTATLRVTSGKLGPSVSIDVEPTTAELSLDGVALGPGPWVGRLPVGAHALSASEAGYVATTTSLLEPDAGEALPHVVITLAVDPRHPRWPRRAVGTLRVEAFAAVAAGRALGSDAEAWCATPCAHTLGGVVGGRVGFRFPSGASVDLVGGYVTLGESFTRVRTTGFVSEGVPRSITYTLADDAHLRGPFVGVAGGYAAQLRPWLALVSRVTAGVLFAGASDPITGSATTATGSAPIVVSGRGQRVTSIDPFVEPELGLEVRAAGFHVGVGLGLAAFVGVGPPYGHDLLEVEPAGCSSAKPAAPACAPASTLVASERANGPFALLLPTLSAGYGF
jgi:hypothetical protein